MEGLKMLEALLLLFGMLAAAAIGGKESESKDEEETYKSYEKIRVYPRERRAARYHNGKREDYYY